MKRSKPGWARLRSSLSRIHLVDRCLILFMLILLLQSAYSLFFHGGAGTGVSDVDIIVRTSSAAIFGYFLSANFIRHTPSAASGRQTGSESTAETRPGGRTPADLPSSRIGFSIPGQPEEPTRGGAEAAEPLPPENGDAACSRLQVLVATGIGLFCLVTLLLMRNVAQWNGDLSGSTAATATVAQFRDFVSGCVGFLIGCPTHGSGQTKA